MFVRYCDTDVGGSMRICLKIHVNPCITIQIFKTPYIKSVEGYLYLISRKVFCS